MTREEQYLASGAYALDALTPEESLRFERALTESPELATETDGLRATALLLGLAATPVEPSDDLKVRLMAQIAVMSVGSYDDTSDGGASEGDASEGDASDSAAAVPVAQTQDAPRHLRRNDIAPAAGTEVAGLSEGDATVAASRSAALDKAHTRWFARPVGALVAAAAAIAIFVGGGAVATQFLQHNNDSSSQQASASSLAEIYAAPDVASAHSTVAGGGEATVLWSASVGKAAVVAQGLPSLPEGKTYQAWYLSGTTATPAGTFTPGGDATTWHVLTGSLTTGATVGVTVEPAGGSQTPTTTPILAVTSS